MCLKSNIKLLLTIAIAIMSSHVQAQTLSLQNVLDAVEQNNPLLASYRFKIESANTLASGARSWMPPKAGIGPYAVPYDLAANEGSVLFFLEQDIPNPGKLKAKQNYLSSLSAIDSSERSSVKNELFTEAKNAFTDRFIAEKKLIVINEQIDLLNLMIKTSIVEYTYNQSDLPTIYKAQARASTLEAMRTHESSAVKEATVKLNSLMNLYSSNEFMIDSVLPFHDYKLADLDTSILFLTMNNSDISKINHRINSLQLNNAFTLSSSKPDFNIRYEHYDMFGTTNTFSLVGAVTIPIAPWASKGYKSQAASTAKEIDAMNYEKKNSINVARSKIEQTLLHTISEYQEVKHYSQQVIP
ncbi:MAG: TolC family protein, partial [Chitinophagales bacterium]|nr:TolC family protein [Chitinophagales bacterium]